MARKENGEHHRTSRVERFERPNARELTKETMFDFVVKGSQKDFAEKNNQQGQR